MNSRMELFPINVYCIYIHHGNLLLESEDGSGIWSLRSQKNIVSSHRESRVDPSVQRVREMDSFKQEVKLKKAILGYKLALNLKKTNSL